MRALVRSQRLLSPLEAGQSLPYRATFTDRMPEMVDEVLGCISNEVGEHRGDSTGVNRIIARLEVVATCLLCDLREE